MPDRKLTIKEQLWREAFLRCGNATEAARQAGYKDPKQAGLDNKRRQNIPFDEVMEAHGITDALLSQKIADALDATKVVTATEHGAITDEREYVDHATRLKAVDMALKLKGRYAPEKREVSATVQVEDATTRLSDDAVDARLAELEQRDDG